MSVPGGLQSKEQPALGVLGLRPLQVPFSLPPAAHRACASTVRPLRRLPEALGAAEPTAERVHGAICMLTGAPCDLRTPSGAVQAPERPMAALILRWGCQLEAS